VATYANSKIPDMRRKAIKFGAQGATVKAVKPDRPAGSGD